jgi:hypothetical protein
MARTRQPQTIEELLEPHRVWVTPCGCWLWLGGDDGYGDEFGTGAYGRILKPGTRIVEPVHRYVHKKFKGPIPPGYDVDHLCAKWSPNILTIRKCINPDHLEAVPPLLNQQRKFLRRLGYGTEDMDLRHPARTRPTLPDLPPLMAPGESVEDLVL